MLWYDMIWYNTIWYDTIWYDTSRNVNVQNSSSFTNTCLTDSALNVVRLMHCECCRTFVVPCPVSYTNETLIWRTKSSEMCYVLTGEEVPALWKSVLPPSSGSSSVLLHCWTLLIAGACYSQTSVTVYQSTYYNIYVIIYGMI